MFKVLSAALLTSLVATCAQPTAGPPTDADVVESGEVQEQIQVTEEVEELDASLDVASPAPLVAVPQLGNRHAGVLLSRMTVNEGTSLMPPRVNWELDMLGILQVVRNNQRSNESLYDALGRHSPHVARLKEVTRPRQQWTSTLPGSGDGAPEFWTECTGWTTNGLGRRAGTPIDCDGVWLGAVDSWKTVRERGAQLVRMSEPPRAVQGNPKAWGGTMDIARFLERNPNMCWLESGDALNYFFGLKDDPENQCKPMPESLVRTSRLVSVRLMMQDMARRSRDRRQTDESSRDNTAEHEAIR